ncbi:endonuclease VII domain-containing protein [Rhodococcus qingshengii]|uniref:endonuclease VII domain-containing protein n=1 Tax=Rhodococcus qingshengii TaxID=334542 RepID=UPI00071E171A|nr:endonuclease VII domain-containing protein [Rhodococcus qingshengii]KSU77157.1 hypothetical protein AS032_14690 [Rhodococcus qingshengii]SCC37596.1 Recombination endonuclease VII [Rhodococcus qingshengii]
MTTKTCTVEGCERQAYRLNFCTFHYNEQRNADSSICRAKGCQRKVFTGSLCSTHQKRACMFDGCEKPIEGTSGLCGYHRDLNAKAGKLCRVDNCEAQEYARGLCQCHYVKNRNAGKVCRIKDCERQVNSHLLCARHYQIQSMYGITPELYESQRARQDYRCLICRKHESECTKGVLVVDHSHTTGRYRGLLCDYCNTALGFLNDDPEITRRAALYLDCFAVRLLTLSNNAFRQREESLAKGIVRQCVLQ